MARDTDTQPHIRHPPVPYPPPPSHTYLCSPPLPTPFLQVSITVLATGFSLNPTAAEGDNLDDLLTTLDQQLSAPRPKVGPSASLSIFAFGPSYKRTCRRRTDPSFPPFNQQQAFTPPPPPPPPAQEAMPPMYEESYAEAPPAAAGSGKGGDAAGSGGAGGKKGMGGFFKMFRRS